MPLRILHSADWHIGQTFHEYDRTNEHQFFLDWLLATLECRGIDVLLLSGDVYDVSNPSAVSVKLFHSFLGQISAKLPHLQVVITAGNHDSPARLESVKPLLQHGAIHIVGYVERLPSGDFDFEKLCIPLYNRQKQIEAWCLAVPFLRNGDYPSSSEYTRPYTQGIEAFYHQAHRYLKEKAADKQGLIAMGHLHCAGASRSEGDKSEREIMGGLEFVETNCFHEDFAYVALGHIHKAQKVGGQERIRYSGSPLPMSFSELNYKHQVLVFELDNAKVTSLESIEIPLLVSLLRVPAKPEFSEKVLEALEQLPEKGEGLEQAPFLEVRVLLKEPDPSLRSSIETILEKKQVRLARIDVSYPPKNEELENIELSSKELSSIRPIDVFKRSYQKQFQAEPSEELLTLFALAEEEALQNNN